MTRFKNVNSQILEKGMAAEKKAALVSQLLWGAYLVLDHGDEKERLDMLSKLESHFQQYGAPKSTNG